MPDLSVCIPARNEEWLSQTVADVLAYTEADTDVIVVLDGAWPEPGLPQHPKLQVIYVPQAIGQRAATNLAARVSTAAYVMKLDAHCAVAQGFDRVLLESAQELGPRVVQIPGQRNLHVYDWVCSACGRREYQCGITACRGCGSPDIHKELVWKPRGGTRMIRWRLDSDLHYQGWGGIPATDYVETMSCLGACWFVAKDYWDFLEGLDEAHGSWGQVGCELACKTWLSGGRMVCNTKTDYAHFFRVGGQQFPYEITGAEQEYARQYSRNLWRGNHWPKQIYPLKWLVDRFWPVPGWADGQRDELARELGRNTVRSDGVRQCVDTVDGRDGADERRTTGAISRGGVPTKGIVYYSDSRVRPDIRDAALDTITASGLPIVAVTIPGPHAALIEGVRNIVLPLERGYLTMFRQILRGLEAVETDVVFLCEHDVLYHASHFVFTPPDRERVFYNQHVWKVDATTGRALHYRCSQTSGLCADRQLLIQHYRQRVARVEQHGFSRKMGFEPGTHRRAERVDDLRADVWMSEVPNIDIRHDTNLTPSRWRQDQFRDQRNCAGWTESDRVPGWGLTLGRFDAFLRDAVGVVA